MSDFLPEMIQAPIEPEPEPDTDIFEGELVEEIEEIKEEEVKEEEVKLSQDDIFKSTKKKKVVESDNSVSPEINLIEDKLSKLPKNNKQIYKDILDKNDVKYAKSCSIAKLKWIIINKEIDFNVSDVLNKVVDKPIIKPIIDKVEPVKNVKKVKKVNTIKIEEQYSKQDLEQMVFNGINQYETLRKERKKEKLKQKDLFDKQEQIKNTINNALHPKPQNIYSNLFR
tara:strand:+ start:2388 stop:3065 length:678 start_codon:yes stop_codon:yes gene_type:complete